MALVSICDNMDISLFTKGIIIKNISENVKNIASIVRIDDIASPKWNFLMWNFFRSSHKGRPNIDKIMAMAKYRNMSGKKNINNPTAKIPAMGFMKSLILFIKSLLVYKVMELWSDGVVELWSDGVME